jgi:hypothetical protein
MNPHWRRAYYESLIPDPRIPKELAEKLTLSRKKEEGKRKTLRFSAMFLFPFSFRLRFSAAC